MKRIVWTLVAVALMFALGRMTLPGINRAELGHMIPLTTRLTWGAMAQLSVVALGLRPLISAFILVELFALVVPRVRPLRQSPEGRRKLAYVIAATAILLAAIQGYFAAVWLEALDYGGSNLIAPHMRGLIAITLVGGTMFLVWLVSLINRRGLGNGYAVLLAGGWLMSPNWKGLGEHPPLAFAFSAAAVVVVVIVVVLLTRVRVDGPIPLPSSGLVPLSDIGGGAMFIKQLLVLGFAMPMGVARLIHFMESTIVAAIVILVLTTVLWSWLFTRPALVRDRLARAGYGAPDTRTWISATALTACGLSAIFVAMFATRHYVPELTTLADPFVVAFVAATLLDLVDEARARKQLALVAVWPLHDPILAVVVREQLTAAGIPHHLQSSRLRSMLWFFGPYVPIMVLVPDEHVPAAEKRLRELLA